MPSLLLLFLASLVFGAVHAQQTRFSNWYRSVDSVALVNYPTSDADVLRILSRARSEGKRVRVKGAGHSYDGLVAQRIEDDVEVINLSRYVPPAPTWSDGLSQSTGTLLVSAGKSFLDVMALVRPYGWILPTQTAGPFFSVGGVVSNTVSGGVLGEGFMYDCVVGARVALSNGTIFYTENESQLRKIRGSLGYTGVVLQYRLRLEEDRGIAFDELNFYYDTTPGNAAWVDQFTSDQVALTRDYRSFECFMNPWLDSNGMTAVKCLVSWFRYGSWIEWLTQTDGILPNWQLAYYVWPVLYQSLQNLPEFQYMGDTGGYVADLSSTYDALVCSVVDCDDYFARTIAMNDLQSAFISEAWSNQSDFSKGGRSDGYYLLGVERFDAITSYIPVANVSNPVELVTAVAGSLDAVRSLVTPPYSSDAWAPNGFFEWRFMKPKGSSLFEFLDPSKYHIQFEFVGLTPAHFPLTDDRQIPHYKRFEKLYNSLGGKPHLGKPCGIGSSETWPFGDWWQQNVPNQWGSVQLAAIKSAIAEFDPVGLFSAGAMLRELDPAHAKRFEVRKIENGTCAKHENEECVSGCCSSSVCVLRGSKAVSDRCSVDCECETMRCVRATSDEKRCF